MLGLGFGVLGFRIWGVEGLAFRVWGLGFSLGFGVWGLAVRVWGLGFWDWAQTFGASWVYGLKGFRVYLKNNPTAALTRKLFLGSPVATKGTYRRVPTRTRKKSTLGYQAF